MRRWWGRRSSYGPRSLLREPTRGKVTQNPLIMLALRPKSTLLFVYLKDLKTQGGTLGWISRFVVYRLFILIIYMCIRHDVCAMCVRRMRCVELLQIIYPASFSYLSNKFLRATVSVFSGWEASKRACDNREKSAADKEKMIRRPVSPCRQVPHINSFIYICSSLNTERGAWKNKVSFRT